MIQKDVGALQKIAQQLLHTSSIAEKLYLDQLNLLGINVSQQVDYSLFKLKPSEHKILFLNGLFTIQFYAEKQVPIFKIYNNKKLKNTEKIEQFLSKRIQFYLSDQGHHYSIELREKAQELRDILVNSLFEWADGEAHVKALVTQLSIFQAQEFDRLLIQEQYYDQAYLTAYLNHQHPLPEHVFHVIKTLCHLDTLDEFLLINLQQLVYQLDAVCVQIADVMPRPLYRICEVLFLHHFSLFELSAKQNEIADLWKHAEQTPNILGFVQLINKAYWKEDHIFSKHHFFSEQSTIWLSHILHAPIFDHKKVVNWIYRQDHLVLDWLSQSLQYHSVRVSVAALSFIDCSHFHPNIILSALQYFQYSATRMVVQSFAFSQDAKQWLETLPIKMQQQFNQAQPSILYLDEWLQFIRRYCLNDVQKLKQIFLNLSRLMQAYMQHLQCKTQHLPSELIYYMQTEKQQERYFHFVLQRSNLKLDDFRECFYLRERHLRESVFSPYVRDFLLDYLSRNIILSKHITWLGLFHKAVRWHHYVQKEETLLQIKRHYSTVIWQSFTSGKLQFLNWSFDELNNIEKIIEESQIFHHCLASAYIEQIMSCTYVAFHMWSDKLNIHLTLGCHIRDDVLEFDQLEYPHNQKAEQLLVNIARQFIDYINEK